MPAHVAQHLLSSAISPLLYEPRISRDVLLALGLLLLLSSVHLLPGASQSLLAGCSCEVCFLVGLLLPLRMLWGAAPTAAAALCMAIACVGGLGAQLVGCWQLCPDKLAPALQVELSQ